MESSEFVVDGALYTFEEVVRAAHRLSDACNVELGQRDGAHTVRLNSRTDLPVPADARARLFNALTDEKLRTLIREETQGLHQELVRAALAHAMPRPGASS